MSPSTPTSNRHGSAVITLSGDTDLTITRLFDAPATSVFRAFTTPDLVKRWWAGPEAEWLACEIDLQAGGHWRWLFRTGGMEVGFHGDYREVQRPNRLVYTEIFEMPGPPPPLELY